MKESLNYIYSELKDEKSFKIAVILGSGLGFLADEINGISLSYDDIPGFCKSKVEGHKGRLVFGNFFGKEIVAMQGRFHFYEGYPMEKVVFPIKVLKELGVETLIITNAAGGINTGFSAGNLMVIDDHINFMGTNPLISNGDSPAQFIDMTNAYDKNLKNIAFKATDEIGLKLQKGVYAALTGPSYETPAEIRMLRTLGADAVGMSTVPEVICANSLGIKVLGISCITNMAAGITGQALSHQEVIDTAERVKKDFAALIKTVISKIEV